MNQPQTLQPLTKEMLQEAIDKMLEESKKPRIYVMYWPVAYLLSIENDEEFKGIVNYLKKSDTTLVGNSDQFTRFTERRKKLNV